MAIDGIYLYSLVQDLKKSIINSKIDGSLLDKTTYISTENMRK